MRAIIWAFLAFCERPRARRSGKRCPATVCSTNGSGSPFSWPPSTPRRRKARPRLAATILRETLAKGGRACRPLVAANGLSNAFVNPALRRLEAKKAEVSFERRLPPSNLPMSGSTASISAATRIEVAADERVILAVPAPVAASLLPGLKTPQAFRAIVNAHFKIAPPAGLPSILGVVNGTIEWLFAFPGPAVGDDQRRRPPDRCAARGTRGKNLGGCARATQIAEPMPAWQIIKEKRATFAATAEEEARRPPAQTDFGNLLLAGDWTATGLPATIEGAIRSGFAAAEAILQCE